MNLIWLAAGIVLLVIGAELLVRGASRLAIAFGLSPLVVGLTVVAFGTSAPEFAVSVAAAVRGDPSIAVGNVIGSNIFNVLVILGASSLVCPLSVSSQLIRTEIPLMILATFVTWLMAANGVVGRGEGMLLFLALIAYTAWAISKSRRETKAALVPAQESRLAQQTIDTSCCTSDGSSLAAPLGSFGHWRAKIGQAVLIGAGLSLLVFGSHLLVQGAVGIATALGVSSSIIGLTIVAAGTSLPEVATSLLAAYRGEKEIAIGNVVGSNLFNLLGVLGATALVSPVGIQVAPSFLEFDFPAVSLVALAVLPIAWTGRQVNRWEGASLLVAYVFYIGLLI
ncbi:cation:H+ antiporter [Neorhodopirellula lusitana]|uniref:Cation:H+ antiporter n=1 Tax=Neorhodopirellula lusitana TaxID=445327 RepID=A0ABY1Q5U2_9BACT|nr:calcium/sodium antiporter [Neorhodopirellula lusitana]SMP59600.1 cation:H+ antiporter [Neorhodopirellula lusitana]